MRERLVWREFFWRERDYSLKKDLFCAVVLERENLRERKLQAYHDRVT